MSSFIHTYVGQTHLFEINVDISKITPDGDPTKKNHVKPLLEILPGRRGISVKVSRSGESYFSKSYYCVNILISNKVFWSNNK